MLPLSRTGSARLSVEVLEDRTTPTFLTRPGPQQLNVNGVGVPTGGLSIAVGNLLPDTGFGGLVENEYVTGTGPGMEGLVRVWRFNGRVAGQGGVPAFSFTPFAGFQGGLNVAVGDVLGDGTPEIIVAPAGNGPPHVKVFTASGRELGSFMAFEPGFLGGVNLAVGNVLGGIAAGGFSGGAVSKDFKQEIIVGAAAGGVPHVVVTDAAGTVFRSFLAFDLGYQGGVTVAAASIDATRTAAFTVTGSDTNAYDEIIVGAATAIPHVKAFEVWTGAITERLSFYAFDPSIQQGVTVAAGTTANRRGADIFVSQIVPTTSTAAPAIRVYDATGALQVQFSPFPSNYSRVVNMTVGYLTSGRYDPSDDDSQFFGFDSFDFLTQDLTVVAGDGPYEQAPRFFMGLPNAPAGSNGP